MARADTADDPITQSPDPGRAIAAQGCEGQVGGTSSGVNIAPGSDDDTEEPPAPAPDPQPEAPSTGDTGVNAPDAPKVVEDVTKDVDDTVNDVTEDPGGTVNDTNGAAVIGAQVQISGTATRTVTADAAGAFSLDQPDRSFSLDPARRHPDHTYALRADLLGQALAVVG